MLTKSLRYVSMEVRNLPHYDGLDDVNLFLDKFEREVPEEHWFEALDLVLRTMPTCWWGTHNNSFTDLKEYRRMMKLRFRYGNSCITEKYTGKDGPHDNLACWTKSLGVGPQPKWVHIFSHTLDTILMN